MKDHKKVSNPLTIIAIFAGLAEVAGTGVMPFLSPELQQMFIWYVMGFPVLLVVLFFVVLLTKREVLYGPSDFSDQKNFMELLKGANQIKETVQQIARENPALEDKLEPIIQKTDNMVDDYINVIWTPPGNESLDKSLEDVLNDWAQQTSAKK